jgi:hypothetical protein
MWKIDPKDEHTHKPSMDILQNMFAIAEVLYGSQGRKERKEE